MTKRVVITGLGTINPIGSSVPESLEALRSSRSGLQSIELPLIPKDYWIGGQALNFDPNNFFSHKEQQRYPRFIQLAVAAAQEALQNALYESPEQEEDVGVFIGVGIGGIGFFEEQMAALRNKGYRAVSPFCIPSFIPNMASGVVAEKFKLTGANFSITSACSSGAHSIGEAYHNIQLGRFPMALAGGVESALSPGAYAGFGRLKALANRIDPLERTSRPFDRTRNGFVMGEGAGILVLEELSHARKRGAHIWAEVCGYGSSGDAYHMTSPHPDGLGAQKAMRKACDTIPPEKVGYINAHGTSTLLNDAIETQAIHKVFQEQARKIKISSTKSATGHLLGAAGSVEAVFSILALSHQFVPATLNYEEPDPECDLDYVPNEAQDHKFDYVLSNSFGFGGTNACLLFGRV